MGEGAVAHLAPPWLRLWTLVIPSQVEASSHSAPVRDSSTLPSMIIVILLTECFLDRPTRYLCDC